MRILFLLRNDARENLQKFRTIIAKRQKQRENSFVNCLIILSNFVSLLPFSHTHTHKHLSVFKNEKEK